MSSDESTCAITDSEAAVAVGVVYCFITGFMMLITHCCRKKNADDKYAKDRFAYAEYMGRYPLFSFLLTGGLLVICCGMAVFTPCLELKSFNIDKNTQNYIKSVSDDTDYYDAMWGAVEENKLSEDWPQRRRTQELSLVEAASEGEYSRALSGVKHTPVTFVFMTPYDKLPRNVFTDDNLLSIRDFEMGVMDLPDYSKFCRKLSYYSNDPADSDTCATQAQAVSEWFFEDGNLIDVDGTLKTMAENGVTGFCDIYFTLDNLGSNLTRSTFSFEYTNLGEYNTWLTETVVPYARKSQKPNYRVLYYSSGFLFDWEVDEAVMSDSMWSGLSFAAVLLFVWLHTRSLLISILGMLGVTASVPVTLWIFRDILGFTNISLLNFLSLFVIMGIGADDIFVFYDTYIVVANEDADIHDDRPAHLARSFSRACSAMLVTSASTAASFFANFVSSLPVIKEFGIFMGVVVVVNFITIVIYFPSIILIQEKYCCCCNTKRSVQPRAGSFAAGVAHSFNEQDDDDILMEGGASPPPPTTQSLSQHAPNLGTEPRGGSFGSRLTESVRSIFQGRDINVNYDRESFVIKSDAGWGCTERFFHNIWAPFLARYRLFVIVVTLSVCVAAAGLSFLMVEAADKAPSFFPPHHNIGMLELVNSEYVASTTIDLKVADAAAWGLISGGDGGGGGGGGGGDEDLVFCPTVDGKQCADHGTCNTLSGQCLCYVGWSGSDCSAQTNEELTPGNLALSERLYLANAYDMSTEVVQTMTITNSGQTTLNWYFFILSPTDGTDVYLSNEASSVPSWIDISSYSGSVNGMGSTQVSFTFKPASMSSSCTALNCNERYEFYFTQTGVDDDYKPKVVTELTRGTRAPTVSPTSAPTVPTLAPSIAPTVLVCFNNVKDGDETDVDCGGGCPACGTGQVCVLDDDCESFNCNGGACGLAPTASPTTSPTTSPTIRATSTPTTSPTVSPTAGTCTDARLNGAETDVDCGGADCPGCSAGRTCSTNDDCLSKGCLPDNTCSAEAPTASPSTSPTLSPSLSPTTSPTTSAPTISPTIAPTISPSQAPSLSPTTASPTAGSCTDDIQNGEETGIDCGGPDCRGCGNGAACALDRDCSSDSCDNNLCVAATASPTVSPTSSPTSSAPTIAPTRSPSLAPSAAPTMVDCNSAFCTFHGRCTKEEDTPTCSCFPGYIGDRCEVQETLEKSSQVEIDIYWGVKGIDRSRIDEDFTSGYPVYLPSFDVGDPEAQLFLRDSCDAFRNASSSIKVFSDGGDWNCFWEFFDYWLRLNGRGQLPMAEEELMTNLLGDGVSVEGFFSRIWWNTPGYKYERNGVSGKSNHGWYASVWFKDHVGFDFEARKVLWTRITVDTLLEETLSATEGEADLETWRTFLASFNHFAPSSLGDGKMASFLWVRIVTELMLVRSTVMAWAISNLSAFVAIILFTRNFYISVMTTVTIFMIVVCLVGAMVVLLGWNVGAMEALSVTIFVGMACDYCLHIAHAFMHSEAPTRALRVRQALTGVGNAVLGAAITTIGACAFLLFCTITFFFQMGIVVGINTLCSIFFALVFFPSILSIGETSGGGKKSQAMTEVSRIESSSLDSIAISDPEDPVVQHERGSSTPSLAGPAPRVSVASEDVFKQHPLPNSKAAPGSPSKTTKKTKKSSMTEVEVEMSELVERRSQDTLDAT